MKHEDSNSGVIVLGGGLAGLSAAHVLAKADRNVLVFEADSSVGGLSKTITKGNFRFDLGGHRFFTNNERVETFIRELMGEELLEVPRSSVIYLQGKRFDYPLKPLNATFGLGVPTTMKILHDYAVERLKDRLVHAEKRSLEDWVVSRFGRTMFNIYFKEYSEKVWGIDCSRISAEWVEKRIQGLSLGRAIKNAFFSFSGKDMPTLADKFLYPSMGIGRISDKLREAIDKNGLVLTSARAERLHHANSCIKQLEAKAGDFRYIAKGNDFVSSIPVTSLAKMLKPSAPKEILKAAANLRYRDLVIVAVMIDRERVTDQTWVYVPEQKTKLGRIHEPKNWSAGLAPAGKTLLVAEYFCFRGDDTWVASDKELAEGTIAQIENLGFIKGAEALGSVVIRVPKAYPLLEVGYERYYGKVMAYLGEFKNLHTIGRGGTFQYLNMDHAIGAGLQVAEKIIAAARVETVMAAPAGKFALAGEAR